MKDKTVILIMAISQWQIMVWSKLDAARGQERVPGSVGARVHVAEKEKCSATSVGKANMSNRFVRGCTTIQKSALNNHKSSHSDIEATRVVNQNVAMVKHVEKSLVENTNTMSHRYPHLINLLHSARCPSLKNAPMYTQHDTVSEMEEELTITITSTIDGIVGIIVDETTNNMWRKC